MRALIRPHAPQPAALSLRALLPVCGAFLPQTLATNRSGLVRVAFTLHTTVRKDRSLRSVGVSLLYPFGGLGLALVQGANGSGVPLELSTPQPPGARHRLLEGGDAKQRTDVQVAFLVSLFPEAEPCSRSLPHGALALAAVAKGGRPTDLHPLPPRTCT